MKGFATLLIFTAIISIAVAVDDETSLSDSWLENTEPSVPDDLMQYPPELRDYVDQSMKTLHRPSHELVGEWVDRDREHGILVMTDTEARTYIATQALTLEKIKSFLWKMGSTIFAVLFDAVLSAVFGVDAKTMSAASSLIAFFSGCMGSVVEKVILSGDNAHAKSNSENVKRMDDAEGMTERLKTFDAQIAKKECVKEGLQKMLQDLLLLWCNTIVSPLLTLIPHAVPPPHNLALYLGIKATKSVIIPAICPVFTLAACAAINQFNKIFDSKINEWNKKIQDIQKQPETDFKEQKVKGKTFNPAEVKAEKEESAKKAMEKWQTLKQLFNTFQTFICMWNTIGLRGNADGGNGKFIEPKTAPTIIPSGTVMETTKEAEDNPILMSNPKVVPKCPKPGTETCTAEEEEEEEKSFQSSGACLPKGKQVTKEMKDELDKLDKEDKTKTNFFECSDTAGKTEDTTDQMYEQFDPYGLFKEGFNPMQQNEQRRGAVSDQAMQHNEQRRGAVTGKESTPSAPQPEAPGFTPHDPGQQRRAAVSKKTKLIDPFDDEFEELQI